MFAVEVRDHVMIAHSLPGEAFGPAQGLHGATFIIDVAFFRDALTANDIVLVPIRSGLGLRLGANIGYLKFTPQATWNPF